MSDIFRDYSFGGQLRHLRLSKNETLRDFAKRVGIDVGNYSKLENGILSPPRTLKKCKEMLDSFDIPDEHQKWLLGLAYEHHLGRLRERWKDQKDQSDE